MTIAGIGSRTLAWLLDGLVLGAVLLIVGLASFRTANTDSLLALGLLSMATLLLPLGYLVMMESLNGGRTLGKMAAGIKVVRVTGAPIGFGAAIIRALFLPVDILLFGVGFISVFVSGQSQRIGDFAAGTVVVRDRIRQSKIAPIADPAVYADRPRWDVSAITEEEIGVIRSFLSRASALPSSSRSEYARQLRNRIEPRIGGGEPAMSNEAYLKRVVVEKTRT